MKSAHLATRRSARSRFTPGRRWASAACLALAGAFALFEPAVGQRPGDTPMPLPFYAIQNARIVPVSGPVIENGTVVIADGLIEAVGTNVTIPPEAWAIDGSGLTVYPGLIDGMSQIAVRRTEEGDGTGGATPASPFGGSQQEIAEGPEDRPATHPWTAAADLLDPGSNRIESWREGGFTSALVVPEEGIITGQAALINLAGDEREMVVKTPAALRITMDPPGGFRSFPGSLFGVISYVKQLYADADHYTRYKAAYEANPRGRDRPEYDRTLEPIQRSIREGWPTILPGSEEREIRRAVRLGRDVGARVVVAGAHDAYAMAGELATEGVPVLVNLDWPERPRDADPEAEPSLETLRRRVNAPTTPARLHEAGATWAFYSGGLATPRQLFEKVNEAIDEGLSSEAAVRALTLGPAEIFGVDDRLGSIETGKIANLVVTDGDLFDEGTRVRMVFIDGRKFEKREEERPTDPPSVDVTGRWLLTIPTPQRTQEVTADLEMAEDGTLSGSLSTDRGEQVITDGWVSGDRFSFTANMSLGGRSFEVVYTGEVEGEAMEGTVSFGGRFSTDFTGQRPGGVRS